jgi:hypothetical protein
LDFEHLKQGMINSRQRGRAKGAAEAEKDDAECWRSAQIASSRYTFAYYRGCMAVKSSY